MIIIEKYSANIPQDFDFIDKEQRAIKKEDAINDEEILIKNIQATMRTIILY